MNIFTKSVLGVLFLFVIVIGGGCDSVKDSVGDLSGKGSESLGEIKSFSVTADSGSLDNLTDGSGFTVNLDVSAFDFNIYLKDKNSSNSMLPIYRSTGFTYDSSFKVLYKDGKVQRAPNQTLKGFFTTTIVAPGVYEIYAETCDLWNDSHCVTSLLPHQTITFK